MGQQLELFVTIESQEKLEEEIGRLMTSLLYDLFNGVSQIDCHRMAVRLRKNLIEYFDNTRLLQNQPKEKVEL